MSHAERLLAVAEHYYHFEGKSPINQQTARSDRALEAELERNRPNTADLLGKPKLASAAARHFAQDETGWRRTGVWAL